MVRTSAWTLACLASTSMACTSTAWLIVPDERLSAGSSGHVVLRTDGGQEHDLGPGEWSTTGVGIEVLRVPAVRRGELHAELLDGSHLELAFDEGDYDSDRNGVADREDSVRYGAPGASSFEAARRRQQERSEEDRRRRDDEASERMLDDDD